MSRLRLRMPSLGVTVPTLSIQSTLGAAPLVLQWSDAAYIVGQYGQLQIDQTSNAFANITQNIIFFIDGASWGSLDESIGLVTPSGQYWARIRTARDDDFGATTVTGNDPLGNALSFTADVSPWSNIVHDTIVAVTTIWNTVDGANKNTNVAISGTPPLIVTGTAGFNGSPCWVRATVAQTGKIHFEDTITTLASGNPNYIGIEDGTTTLGPSVFPNPVTSFTGYRTDGVIYKNGSVLTGPAASVQGDVIEIEFDTVAATMTVYRNGTSLGSVTGITASAYYPATGLEDANVFTANFGQNAFVMTPSTGYGPCA